MNAAQAQCKLSEHTFKETLLRCTTGEVYDSVATMVDGNIQLFEIYNALLTKYDTRLRPEHAQLELENFVLPKDPTFNKVVSKIMALCQRACLEHGEPARTQIYNLTAIGYLLKNLPYGSINDGLKIRADLITELGRFPTFAEVVQALRKYVGAIDDNSGDASAVTEKYVENAVDALLSGKEVNPTFTKAIGCSIKWKN